MNLKEAPVDATARSIQWQQTACILCSVNCGVEVARLIVNDQNLDGLGSDGCIAIRHGDSLGKTCR